jgi:hypothetical protein
VLVTGLAGTTLTWVRAAEAIAGVQAASAHGIGATLTAIVTAASLNALTASVGRSVKDFGARGDGVTDDTLAIQAAIDVAEAEGGGVVYFPPGVYVVGGALQDTGRSNAQLLLPRRDYVDTEQITIVLRGATPPPAIMSVIGDTPLPDGHSIIKGTLNVASGTSPALLGSHGPVGTYNEFTNILVRIENLSFRMPPNPQLTALDLSHVAAVDVDRVVVDGGSYFVGGLAEPTTATSFGIRFPGTSNGAHTRVGTVDVIGFYNGYEIAEHTNGQQVAAWGCKQALVFVATNHASHFDRVNVHHCERVLVFTGGRHQFDIDQLNIEHASAGWWVTDFDIDDAGNFGYGRGSWNVVLAGIGHSSVFTTNGGANQFWVELGQSYAATPYIAWTPALLSAGGTNPTLGVGSTRAGRYFQNGKHVSGYGAITFGTSGESAGTLNYVITVPVTPRTPVSNDMNVVGHGQIFDASAGAMRVIIVTHSSPSAFAMRIADGSTSVSATSPWVWAANDVLMFKLDYEAA